MTQEQFKKELELIDEFIKTPVQERPKYKEFHERVKQMADNVTVCPELGHTKELREAEVWMTNRSALQRIQEEESKWYLHAAKVRTERLFKKYAQSLQPIV